MSGSAGDPVAETLRTLDRTRYYATLILPEPQRAAVQALYAASAEIAAIGERVSEPMPGEIRLQWWDDLLSGEARGAAEQNPVAAALVEATTRYSLPHQPLSNLIAARRFDLYADPMPDIGAFEGYAGETASVPLHLAATILNDGKPVRTGDAAGHLGVAMSYFGHVRAFGFNAARGRLFLPLSVFTVAGAGETAIFACKDSPEIRAALATCRRLGAEHLEKARTAFADVPRRLRPAFAPIAMIDATRRQTADPFAPPRPETDWLRLLRLMWFGVTLR